MTNQQEMDEELEIDLKELLLELLSHWKLIIMVTIMAGTIGYFISSFFMVPMYESTSELYIQTNSTSISLTDLQASTNLTNDYTVVVTERPVLETVISNLGLSEGYRDLKDKVSVYNPTNSRFLQITVTDTSSKRAKLIADEIADVTTKFISVKMNQEEPQVVHYGYDDGTVVSPNIVKNTGLSGIVAFVLVSALIAISYIFNDAIMGPEDVEKKLGLNVLGMLPLDESEDDGDGRNSKKRREKGEA